MPTPKDDLSRLSMTQLSELTGCAKETVSKRLREAGLEPADHDGRTLYFVPRLALPVIYEIGKGLSLDAERARLAREQADGKAMQNAVSRGELVAAADVRSTWSAVVLTIKERMRSLPAHAVSKIQGFRKPMAKKLAELVDEVLTELSNDGLPGDVEETGDGGSPARRAAS